MKVSRFKVVLGSAIVAGCASLAGCGSEEIKLKEVPPVPIGAVKQDEPTKSQASLKSGAPPTGSSSGMNHNPSETPNPNR